MDKHEEVIYGAEIVLRCNGVTQRASVDIAWNQISPFGHSTRYCSTNR